MKNILIRLGAPALVGFFLVLPFMLLEWINRRNFNEGFPIALFGILWLLAVVFSMVLMPIIQSMRMGNSLLLKPASLLLRVTFLIVIAILWGSILVDQLPCFLGVPNCD